MLDEPTWVDLAKDALGTGSIEGVGVAKVYATLALVDEIRALREDVTAAQGVTAGAVEDLTAEVHTLVLLAQHRERRERRS